MKVVEKKARDEMIEEAGKTEGARRASGVFPGGAPPAGVAAGAERPEVEVVAKAERRRFTAEYKRRIVREADRCTKPGEIGALLRREGLYSSHLVTWRAARDRGELEGLSPKKRGPKVAPPDPRDKKIAEQEREIARLTKRAERAEGLVEVQKKLAALLGPGRPRAASHPSREDRHTGEGAAPR
jgi:transposase-like protein